MLCSTLLSLHFWHFIIAPEKLKLDFNINTAKWILEKQLQTTESRTNSWEFWYLCKRFSNFYIKWIQIYRETEIQEGYLSIPHHTINTFQRQICCLNSRTFSKNLFLIRNVKRKCYIRHKILNSFFRSTKRTFKETKFTYLLLLYIFSFPWKISWQGVGFHQCIIK